MKNIFCNRLVHLAVLGGLLTTTRFAAAQGSLTPPGAPAPMFKPLSQIEPRTAINGGGAVTISAAGSYYLTTNLAVSSGNAVTITASAVTLDLNGFTISSTASPAAGTAVLLSGLVSNVVIGNGFISSPITNNGTTGYGGNGFANGVTFTVLQPFNTCVCDLCISGCLTYGINLNTNTGYKTGNTVEACLVSDCGNYAILAETVRDCSVNAGNGGGVFASAASRTRAVSYAGTGIHTAIRAESCFGQSTSFYGMDTGNLAEACYGVSSSSIGFNANGSTHTCFGQTATGGYGFSGGTLLNNCYGYHTSAGGIGLYAGAVAIGSVGITSGATGYGIYSGSILNGCIGSGATNAVFSFKYNMP